MDERRERDSNPQSVSTDHRFSRPARYQLRHHSVKYPGRDSNPQNPASKAGTYSSSVTPAKNTSGGDRTRKRPGFLARRIFQFCYRGIFCYEPFRQVTSPFAARDCRAKRPPARRSPDRRPVMIHEPGLSSFAPLFYRSILARQNDLAAGEQQGQIENVRA